ncbi:MAG TPA: site-2 protease family protein, partial [Candidatus Methanofastidiosa archaeon]|nr:site-2 protease family protein [Candidatus Methanofastidiosa archaeon]
MDLSYRCPNCGYKISSKTPRLSPECPKCSYLMEDGLGEEDMEEFSKIIDAIGESRVNTITKYKNVIFLDLGSSAIDYDNIDDLLSGLGYDVYLRERDGRYHAFLLNKLREEGGRFSKPYVYIGLFILTVLSTLYAGYSLSLPLVEEGLMDNAWNGALSFSLGLVAILGLHEMGHKIQSIRSGISSTWPYFIPMPFLPLGTLGALIKIKSPIPTRNDAVYLGASGPLVGLMVAIPMVLVGMRMSYIVPASSLGEGGVSLGTSLLFMLLSALSGVSVPDGMALWIHP